jgi:hypothetical protein
MLCFMGQALRENRSGRSDAGRLHAERRAALPAKSRWAKTVGGMTQTVYRRVERVRSRFIMTMAANNHAPLSRLLAA